MAANTPASCLLITVSWTKCNNDFTSDDDFSHVAACYLLQVVSLSLRDKQAALVDAAKQQQRLRDAPGSAK